MRPIKILYSVKDVFPAWRMDVVELFSRELAKRNVDVHWYMKRKTEGACTQTISEGQLVDLPSFANKSGLYGKLINWIAYHLCNFRFLLRARTTKYDIIQVRDQYAAALVGLIKAKLCSVKFVYWLSYPFPEHELEMSHVGSPLRRVIQLIRGSFGKLVVYRVVMRLSDHNFVQSEQMKRDVARYGVPAARMTAVPMGVSVQAMAMPAASTDEVEPGLVVYLGTLAQVRRMDTMIKAFKLVSDKVPGAKLLLVGQGDHPHELRMLQEESTRLGLDKCVTFTGFLPMGEALKHVRKAAICLSPFYPTFVLRSTSPTKIIEYMAMGKPVVANDHPEQTEIIAQSGAGICVPWSEEAFADAMIYLLKNPEIANEMGGRGPNWVREHRSYDRIADNVYRKYQEILSGKSGTQQ